MEQEGGLLVAPDHVRVGERGEIGDTSWVTGGTGWVVGKNWLECGKKQLTDLCEGSSQAQHGEAQGVGAEAQARLAGDRAATEMGCPQAARAEQRDSGPCDRGVMMRSGWCPVT